MLLLLFLPPRQQQIREACFYPVWPGWWCDGSSSEWFSTWIGSSAFGPFWKLPVSPRHSSSDAICKKPERNSHCTALRYRWRFCLGSLVIQLWHQRVHFLLFVTEMREKLPNNNFQTLTWVPLSCYTCTYVCMHIYIYRHTCIFLHICLHICISILILIFPVNLRSHLMEE